MSFTNRPTASQVGSYAKDLAERVIVTFLQAFGATLVAGGVFDVSGVRNVSAWQAAGVAGIAAVLSLIKGLVAKLVSKKDSASLAAGV